MKKKINIVHLISSLGLGGSENIVFTLYERCDRERFDTKIVYWEDNQALLRGKNYSSSEIIRLRLKKVVSAGTFVQVTRLLRNLKATLIQTHLIDADLIGFFASRLARIPLLITIHSYPFPVERRHFYRYRLISFFSKRILCVSNTVKKHLISPVGINGGKIEVVYNGIDLKRFSIESDKENRERLRKSFGIRPTAKIIGNVSRLIEDKGHEYLLMTIPEILKIHPDIKVLIVGDGELKTALIEQCKKLNISNYVIFAGARTDIPELLDIMDIFVFPTFREAFGICILEAMAMGKPIIATDDAAIPELIENHKEGILVHPGEPRSLSEAILTLLNNPLKSKKMGQAAKERVKDFSLEKMVKRFESIYDELIKR